MLLVGISFGIIYKVCRFFHFAHGGIFTFGCYFLFFLKHWAGLPFLLSFLLAIAISGSLGCLIQQTIYRPLKRKSASPLILLLTSLGIYIVLQNIISIIFGDDTRSIRSPVVEEGINILGARVTTIQLFIICISLLLMIIVAILLKKTKLGKAMQAVANDPDLARVSGIDSEQVTFWTLAIGSVLGGIAGILVALDIDMTPTMGMNALMMGVVTVIIGGVGSIPGIAMGAFLLSVAQHFGAWKISSQWQDAIAFVILIFFLIFRPQGFLGRKIKKVNI
jgi:branched-chain amino acid transport system permease protein